MIATALLAVLAGFGLLALAREWDLESERGRMAAAGTQPFSDPDWERPSRILEDRAKAYNALFVVAGIVALGVGSGMVVTVVTQPVFPAHLGLAALAALVTGGLAATRELYVRLGTRDPTTGPETPAVDEEFTVATEVTQDFELFRETLATARGPGDGAVTAWVLAAARNEQPLDAVAEYGADREDLDPELFERHAESLKQAGIVVEADGHLAVAERLEGADPQQLAAVATSL